LYDPDRHCATHASLLLVGKNPHFFLPGVQLPGRRHSRAADKRGDAPQLQRHSLRRFYVFVDHIEIQNPGGLYGEVTQANLPTRNSYRNPVIAEALKSLGFVNRNGHSVQRAQALDNECGTKRVATIG
jgi:predicted HTH transcriptional regulator